MNTRINRTDPATRTTKKKVNNSHSLDNHVFNLSMYSTDYCMYSIVEVANLKPWIV